MNFEVEFFTNNISKEWDYYLDENNWAWYSSRSDYLKFHNHQNYSFCIRSHMGLCGIVHGTTRISNGYCIFDILGIVIDEGVQRPQIIKYVLDALDKLCFVNNVKEIWIQIPPLSNSNPHLAWHHSVLCDLGFSSELPWGGGVDTHAGYYNAILLGSSIEEIKSGYSKSHRLAVNKGGRSDVYIHCFDNSNYNKAFPEFRSLLTETLERTGNSDYSEDYYEKLHFMFSKGNAILAESKAKDGGRAYVVLDTYGASYNYFAGCQSEEYVKWSGIVHLHHEMIKLLKKNKAQIYGLGPVFPTIKGKMGSICEFKRRFGGQRFPLLCGRRILDSESYIEHKIIGNLFPTYKDYLKSMTKKMRRAIGS